MQLQNQYCVMSIKQNLNQTLSVSTQKFKFFFGTVACTILDISLYTPLNQMGRDTQLWLLIEITKENEEKIYL